MPGPFSVMWLLLMFLGVVLMDNSFNHDVDIASEESGEHVRLQSAGRLVDVLDLDRIQGIKRLLCVGDRILLVTNDSDVGKNWRAGQLLLASDRWRCNATEESPGRGIYVRIINIFFPTDRRMSLHVQPAGPFDMIEEANIHFRYTPGGKNLPQTRTRRRRFIANVLQKILGNIDWHANFSTTIPFNEDMDSKQAQRKFSVHKSLGKDILSVSKQRTVDDFVVQCLLCHGRTNVSYIFELVIKKVNNKPVLLKYTSQFEGDSEFEADVNVKIQQEMGVNYSATLWQTGPVELIRIPVAFTWKLPPVELTLLYSTEARAHVHGYSQGPGQVRTGYRIRGKYTTSQHFQKSYPLQNEVSSYDWQVIGPNKLETDVKSKINITIDIFQKIKFNATVSWRVKDVIIHLSPPINTTIRPSLRVESRVQGRQECVESRISVSGDFNVTKSQLLVDAFGLNIWDVILTPRLHMHDVLISTTPLSRLCHAYCSGPSHLGPPRSIDHVCEAMTHRIKRGTPAFDKLQVLCGDEIVFLSEESENAWCGDSTTQCTSCNISINSNMSRVCADRIVSARLASAITALHHLVKAEWTNESLVVSEAWDEPTSDHPGGQHGNSSLHYEGRAAVLSLTGMKLIQTLERLASLSVCAGFDFVDVDRNSQILKVAVKPDGTQSQERTQSSDHQLFMDAYNSREIPVRVQTCANRVRGIRAGESIPSDFTVSEVVGPPQGPLYRVFQDDVKRLFHYTLNDVEFLPEGGSGELCGQPSRRCRSDCTHTENKNQTEPWTWCSTRITTPRMALKLRQLVKLAAAEYMKVVVIRSFVDELSEQYNQLFLEGRGMLLTSKPQTDRHTGRFAVLAACAGFDYVSYTKQKHIEVFVKAQRTMFPNVVTFQDEESARLSVDPPRHEMYEYKYPEQLLEEAITPELVDGFDRDTFLSEYYTLRDVMCPHRRYFRFDASLLLCLDLVTDEYGRKVEILPGSGYRTQSVNMINFDIRHPEERFRFQTGQAVELRPPGYTGQSDLLTLVKTIFRCCTAFLREEMRGVGVGCHRDRLYLDIRPMEIEKEMDYITLWKAENNDYFDESVYLQRQLLNGGPVIYPLNSQVCSGSPLGSSKNYLTFDFRQKGTCSTVGQSSFCSATLTNRKEESTKLQEHMTSSAGAGRLPRRDIRREIDRCIVDLCGGCAGSGTIWDQKVSACSVVVDRFITRATRAFPDLTDRASFFNTDTVHSSVHSLACRGGHTCVENVQLYSLFMPLVTSRYRPDPYGTIETMMFSSDRNPTPLLELVEQEMAYKARGRVKVFIDQAADIKNIKGVLKVLFVYNRNVTLVEFHVSDDLDLDIVITDLQHRLDVWAGSTCPEYSRFAVAPFIFHTINRERRKRSLHESSDRNEARRKVHEWDLDWMMKFL